MSEKNDGGPAFPVSSDGVVWSNGMTLRHYFAGQALAGLDIDNIRYVGAEDMQEAARACWRFADAMLATEHEWEKQHDNA